MNIRLKEPKMQLKGTVERRLFDTEKLKEIERLMKSGRYSQEFIGELLDEAAKPQFAGNALWGFLSKYFGLDLVIPFLTGQWTTEAISVNLIPTRGKQAIAEQIGGTTTSPVTAIALGTGTTGAAAGDTTLETEIVADGGERGAASVSNVTVTTTNDAEQWQKTFSFTGSVAVTEEGLLDNNAAGGVLLARQVFSAVNVVSGDSLQITHKVQVT